MTNTNEIENMAKRYAYDYAMACYGDNERSQTIASVRFETMCETIAALGISSVPSFNKDELFKVGSELYKAGYRKKQGHLVREETTTTTLDMI